MEDQSRSDDRARLGTSGLTVACRRLVGFVLLVAGDEVKSMKSRCVTGMPAYAGPRCGRNCPARPRRGCPRRTRSHSSPRGRREGVAALQSHASCRAAIVDSSALICSCDIECCRRFLADIDPVGAPAAACEKLRIGEVVVMTTSADPISRPADGERPGARTGADQ